MRMSTCDSISYVARRDMPCREFIHGRVSLSSALLFQRPPFVGAHPRPFFQTSTFGLSLTPIVVESSSARQQPFEICRTRRDESNPRKAIMRKVSLQSLATLLHSFFHVWLVEQRNASHRNVQSYRDAWRLFLRVGAGVDVTVIRSWLGHAHLDTTNHYAQANLETKRNALEQVAPSLRSGKPPRWKRDLDLFAWLDSL